MGHVKYDWDRYGHPNTARLNRLMAPFLTTLCAMAAGLFLWAAIAQDWTMTFVALLFAVTGVVHRLALRKCYGVRERPVAGARIPPGTEFAVTATLERGGYLGGMQVWDCGDGVRFTAAAEQEPYVYVAPLASTQVHGGAFIVERWTVEASAPTAAEAYGRLRDAEPLLLERMPELMTDGLGPRWFRLANGQLRSPCAHPDAEPVDLLLTGETVAWLCPECGQELPADWQVR